MTIRIGIVGLPNVGKSTLFQALTNIPVDTSNYPFCTIDPNIGIKPVNDERLEKIAEVCGSKNIIPDALEFIDIAGLVKNAHQGAGLGNQFLSHIYGVDCMVMVVRTFEDENIPHVLETIDPERDIAIITEELVKKDEEIEERKKEKQKHETQSGAEQKLSKKPVVYIFNSKNAYKNTSHSPSITVDIKLEDDLTHLPPQEQKEFRINSSLDDLNALLVKTLNLITFFTANKNEARSHLVPLETTTHEAAEKVHSDFQEKFIRAEIVRYSDLMRSGGTYEARKMGLVKTEGRDYPLEDGDLIEFKI
ncbi:DUF933 domain-containing protein [Patescibacteria group bacterium]|nr:DUF933 domain-containing protein [Patescibacteria group bacterium]